MPPLPKFCLGFTLLLCLVSAASGQPGNREPRVARPGGATAPAGAQPSQSPSSPKAGDGIPYFEGYPTLLSDEWVDVPEADARLRLPAEALATRTQNGGVSTIDLRASTGRWTLKVSSIRGSTPAATVSEVLDAALLDLAKRAGVLVDPKTRKPFATPVRFVEPAPGASRAIRLRGATGPAERVVVAVPEEDGQGAIRGIALVRATGDRFVLVDLFTSEANLDEGRRVFDAVLASIVIRSGAEASAERQRLIATGDALLRRWSGGELAGALPEKQEWFRLYSPAGEDGAEKEHGYRGVRGWTGKRSELGLGNPGGEDPSGYLAEIVARVVQPTGGEDKAWFITDTRAVFFLSTDRREEAWSVMTTARDSRVTKGQTYSELGARSGGSMSVQLSQPGRPMRQIKPTVPPEGFLSQLETIVLPRLLVKTGAEAEAGFYAYRSDAEAVTMRRDTLKRDAAGAWELTSTFREGEPAQTSTLGADGAITQTRLFDGRRWAPTTLDELTALWKRQGLPTTGDAASGSR